MRYVSIIWEGNKRLYNRQARQDQTLPHLGCDLPVSRSCAHYTFEKKKDNEKQWLIVAECLQTPSVSTKDKSEKRGEYKGGSCT